MIIEEIIKQFWVKVALVFGIAGFLVSLLLGLVFGSGFSGIIIRPVISGLFMSLVWTASYFLIKRFVPDLLALFEKNSGAENTTPDPTIDDDFNFDLKADESRVSNEDISDLGDYGNVSENIKLGENETSTAKDSPGTKPKAPRKTAKSDEILVDGIPMKKDPELMARAIQHVLDSDKE